MGVTWKKHRLWPYIVPVNKHPLCLASISFIIRGNTTQERGAFYGFSSRGKKPRPSSAPPLQTTASAVHEATIVSSQISSSTGSLSLFIRSLLLLLCICQELMLCTVVFNHWEQIIIQSSGLWGLVVQWLVGGSGRGWYGPPTRTHNLWPVFEVLCLGCWLWDWIRPYIFMGGRG